MSLPPASAWPSEVLPDEPAHGFFRRLAMSNGMISARVFAELHGLNGRNVLPQEFIEFCQMFPSKNIERMVEATPVVEGNFASLAGETLSISRDIGFKRVRLCQACIAEAAYHRNWFDSAIVCRCPFHDLVLIDGIDTDKLAWWHPDVATSPKGEDLRLYGVERVSRQCPSWEAYVLGRIGAAEPISVPLLDEHSLTDVAYVADVLGLSSLTGWTRTSKGRLTKYDPMRGPALQAGFAILAKGAKGAKDHLRQIAEAGPYRTSGPRTGIYTLYGSLRTAIFDMPNFSLANSLRGWLEEVAAELGVVSRKGRSLAKKRPGVACYTLNEVAKVLSIPPAKTRLLLEKLGLSSKLATKSDRHWISAEDLALVQETMGSLLLRDEAREKLSLSPSEFDEICQETGLTPYIRFGGSGQRSDRYLASDIARLKQRRRP